MGRMLHSALKHVYLSRAVANVGREVWNISAVHIKCEDESDWNDSMLLRTSFMLHTYNLHYIFLFMRLHL